MPPSYSEYQRPPPPREDGYARAGPTGPVGPSPAAKVFQNAARKAAEAEAEAEYERQMEMMGGGLKPDSVKPGMMNNLQGGPKVPPMAPPRPAGRGGPRGPESPEYQGYPEPGRRDRYDDGRMYPEGRNMPPPPYADERNMPPYPDARNMPPMEPPRQGGRLGYRGPGRSSTSTTITGSTLRYRGFSPLSPMAKMQAKAARTAAEEAEAEAQLSARNMAQSRAGRIACFPASTRTSAAT